jgi:antitoxin (DNA-binding transcriptional repressor) of toxin-antitoxin stability system
VGRSNAVQLLAQPRQRGRVRVALGEAKIDLSELLARVDAGEEVEIARDGVPVARSVRIQAPRGTAAQFLTARGSPAGRISLGDEFEVTDQELDEMLGESG